MKTLLTGVLIGWCLIVPSSFAESLALRDDDRILVLAPHPDDEVLGCGGILQRAVAAGLPVKVVFLTNGDSNEWSFLAYRLRPTLLSFRSGCRSHSESRIKQWSQR